MHAEERTVRYVQQVQRENQCVQREQLRQVRVRRKLTGQREPYAQKDRLRQQDVPAEREDRYVRREMTDHSVQAVTERTVRFVTAVMQEADVRMETEEVSVRKEDRVTTVMQEADANRGSEAAITVMEEMVRDLVLTEKMITAEMTVRTETQLQSSSSRRAREIRRKIKREIIRRKNTETRHLRARAKKAKSRKMWSK